MIYQLPEGLDWARIEAQLRRLGPWLNELPTHAEIQYLDTFDWAIYQAGGLLERHADRLEWHALDGSASLSQPIADPPGLAMDLPEGPVQRQIAALCGVRRLLPMLQISLRTRLWRLLDARDKTLVRLVFEEAQCQDPRGDALRALPARLRLVAVRGYDAARDLVQTCLEETLALPRVTTPLLRVALAACGRQPADYTAKLDYRLVPTQPAGAATRQILLGLLDTLEANVPGAAAGLDSEFLHDLRVATRRTRSALGQIKGVLPPASLAQYRARFAWLQQVTGPVRDLDVYLLAFDGYRDSLPLALRPHLEPLRDLLRTQHREAQQQLAGVLESAELHTLLVSWRDLLADQPQDEAPTPRGAAPIKQVADARIRRLAKRVGDAGRAISPESPPEQLHALRKDCKKLRYLMEFFQSLYPEQTLRLLIKQLKALLDQLGAYQDLAVQATQLMAQAERLRADPQVPTASLLAVGALVGGLLARQQQAGDGFAEVFAAFDQPQQWHAYRTLFWKRSTSAGKADKGAQATDGDPADPTAQADGAAVVR